MCKLYCEGHTESIQFFCVRNMDTNMKMIFRGKPVLEYLRGYAYSRDILQGVTWHTLGVLQVGDWQNGHRFLDKDCADDD